MSRGYLPFPLIALSLAAVFSVGCLSRKKDDVAVEAAAPPPAAYPAAGDGYADSTSPTSPTPSMSSPVAPAPAPKPAEFSLREGETMVSYRIEPGDNLSSIAAKYNTSVSRIQAANGMTDTKIFAGKSLEIPTAAPPGLAMNTPTPPSPTGSGSYGSTGSFYGSPAPSAPASSGTSGYPDTTTAPSSLPGYPATTGTSGSSPASTSYPRVASPPIPPQGSQPAGAFPTPSFGGSGSVQFSE